MDHPELNIRIEKIYHAPGSAATKKSKQIGYNKSEPSVSRGKGDQMLRLCLKVGLLMLLACLTLAISARALGSAQPAHPALRGFTENCAGEMPSCWYGIVPGLTTASEALTLMTRAGAVQVFPNQLNPAYLYFSMPAPYSACIAAFQTKTEMVVEGRILVCFTADMRLGDVLALWGWQGDMVSTPPHDLTYDLVSINADGWPAPFTRISNINLLADAHSGPRFRWHGFVPRWRYCQLEPSYPRCR